MSKNIIFYLVGGLLTVLLTVYVVYLINFLLIRLSVVSRADLLKVPEIATFNLEKFKELKISP